MYIYMYVCDEHNFSEVCYYEHTLARIKSTDLTVAASKTPNVTPLVRHFDIGGELLVFKI